jgi:hypothetical protein
MEEFAMVKGCVKLQPGISKFNQPLNKAPSEGYSAELVAESSIVV